MVVQTFTSVNENCNELSIIKKAGGSIVEYPPVFSSCGKKLFVVVKSNICSYSVETAELTAVYSDLTKDAIGIAIHPYNSNKFFAVSCDGEMIEWDFLSRNTIVRKIKLGCNGEKLVVQSFFLLEQKDEESLLVVCVVTVPGKNYACLKLFSSVSGQEERAFQNIIVDDNNRSAAVKQYGKETLLVGFCNKPKPKLTFCFWNGVDQNVIQHSSSDCMTCVACHPTEHCVITGDTLGCVKIWRNLLKKPLFTVYHWHTLPVHTVAFSDSGSYFFSGGGECVLVSWLLESSFLRRFLPRLSGEIMHVSVSPLNTCISVSTSDNAIHLVDSSLSVFNVIQHFSWSSGEFPYQMAYDPRTQTLVANGHVGHLQFFSIDKGNLVFSLDVVYKNYLTRERSKIIKNTDVVKFSLSADGIWLATVEFCDGSEKIPRELRLKFWEYNKVEQKYVLNTSVENPHRGAVSAIEFCPSTNDQGLMCVTTGEDMKFRTWVLDESSSIYKKGFIWNIENVGFYRHLPIGALSFSTDGSLMALSFGATLTVWVPVSNELKCSLTRPDNVENLHHVKFGRRSCAHLVVTGSKTGIAVWNLLSVSLLWSVQFNLSILVSDPKSDFLATFSNENDIVIFSPNCPEPVFQQNNLISREESDIVCAVFIPHSHKKNSKISWQSSSQLYFLNSKHEMLCLEHPSQPVDLQSGRSLDNLPEESYAPNTAYAALLAQQSQSDTIGTKKELHKHLGIPGLKTLKEFVDAPAHSMPPLSILGYSVLLSFISKVDERPEKLSFEKETSVEKMEVSDESGVDSGDEVLPTLKNEQKEQDLKKKIPISDTPAKVVDIEESLMEIQNISWDWVEELLT